MSSCAPPRRHRAGPGVRPCRPSAGDDARAAARAPGRRLPGTTTRSRRPRGRCGPCGSPAQTEALDLTADRLCHLQNAFVEVGEESRVRAARYTSQDDDTTAARPYAPSTPAPIPRAIGVHLAAERGPVPPPYRRAAPTGPGPCRRPRPRAARSTPPLRRTARTRRGRITHPRHGGATATTADVRHRPAAPERRRGCCGC